jgi:hypothetical protein
MEVYSKKELEDKKASKKEKDVKKESSSNLTKDQQKENELLQAKNYDDLQKMGIDKEAAKQFICKM